MAVYGNGERCGYALRDYCYSVYGDSYSVHGDGEGNGFCYVALRKAAYGYGCGYGCLGAIFGKNTVEVICNTKSDDVWRQL